jgi:hypothetical protein
MRMSEKTLNDLFYKLILLNELSGNVKAALRFSDPDGLRSGKSGWSYGVCQFDTQNNDMALTCLRECGFTEAEIRGIVDQTIDVRPLAAKLQANAKTIEKYSTAQLTGCLNSAMNVCTTKSVPATDTAAILALADYVNQYGSIGPQFVSFLLGLDRPVVARDILTFKLEHTKYGRAHPSDCNRRYNNIGKVMVAA